jgi:multiple sugar transport system substrate-binding protein
VRFLTFLLGDQQVLEITQANGAVPATFSALDASGEYHQDSLLNLFKVQLTEGYSAPRPRTPAYPIITAVFQQAFDDIRHGADVQTALDQAAAEIDRDLRDNQGYPAIKGDGQ